MPPKPLASPRDERHQLYNTCVYSSPLFRPDDLLISYVTCQRIPGNVTGNLTDNLFLSRSLGKDLPGGGNNHSNILLPNFPC